MAKRTQLRSRSVSAEGFTLVELLVSITIMGILSAVVVFSVSGIVSGGGTGQKEACRIDTRVLRTAEAAYYANPAAGSEPSYTEDEDLLAREGFLAGPSDLHNLTLNPRGSERPFDVLVADARCGTVGHWVGCTTTVTDCDPTQDF